MEKALNINYLDMINIELNLKERRTVLSGDSGTGKSYLYSLLYEYNLVGNDDKIKCLSIDNIDKSNPQLTIDSIKGLKDYVIVIDQADEVFRHNEIRDYVLNDNKNFYVIIGRNCATYVTELAQPVINGNNISIEYMLDFV